jgi:DNA replication protein DnaC
MDNQGKTDSQRRHPENTQSKVEVCACGVEVVLLERVIPAAAGTNAASFSFWTNAKGNAWHGKCDACENKAAAEAESFKAENERRAKAHDHVRILGGPKPFKEFTFERFVMKPGNKAAYETARRFTAKGDNLFLTGPCRVGKTHLATAIAHHELDTGGTAEVWTYPDLIRAFLDKQHFFDFEGQRALMRRLTRAAVLVIDDYGLGTGSDFTNQVFWEILNTRMYNYRNGLVVTSNLDLDALAVKYGDKVPSRLNEMCGDRVVAIAE